MKRLFSLCFLILLLGCISNIWGFIINTNEKNIENSQNKIDHQIIEVKKATIVPKIDGKMDDPIWKEVLWHGFDQNWGENTYTFNDFFGRYKIAWTPEALYVLVETKDDVLHDHTKDPLRFWWNDDSLDIYIDANNSGGSHKHSNNAFAYNINLDENVVGIDENENPILRNDHINMKRVTQNDVTIWEFEIIIYDEKFKDGHINDPMILQSGQKSGFAIAYNDNDGYSERESLIGSVFIAGNKKSKKLINADVFCTIVLKE